MRDGPVRDGVSCIEGAFTGVAGIADHSGRSAGEHDRPVSGLLKAPQGEQWHQMAGMQARSGRVESRVHGHDARGEVRRQCVAIGRLGDQAPPVKLLEDAHASIFPHQSLSPGAGARGLRRYDDTSGWSGSQNRHGRSAAWLTPTRGPHRALRRSHSVSVIGPSTGEEVDSVVLHRDSKRLAQVARAARERRGAQ